MGSSFQCIDVHELLSWLGKVAVSNGLHSQVPDLSGAVFVEDGEPCLAEVCPGFGRSRMGEVNQQSKKESVPWALQNCDNVFGDWGSDWVKENKMSGAWTSCDVNGSSDWGKENQQGGAWTSFDLNGGSAGNGDSTHEDGWKNAGSENTCKDGNDQWGSSAGGTGGSPSQGGWGQGNSSAERFKSNRGGSKIPDQIEDMNERRNGTFGSSGPNAMPLGKRLISRKAEDNYPSNLSNEGVMKKHKGVAFNQWDNEVMGTDNVIGTSQKSEGFWQSESCGSKGNDKEAGWSTGEAGRSTGEGNNNECGWTSGIGNAAGNGNISEAGWSCDNGKETTSGWDTNTGNAEAGYGSGKEKFSVAGWVTITGNAFQNQSKPAFDFKERPPRQAGCGSKSEPQGESSWRPRRRDTNSGGEHKPGLRIPMKREQLRTLLDTPEYAEVAELVKECSRILHSSGYQNGDKLNSEDEKFILEKVLSQHPDKDAKLGCGVDHVIIDNHPDYQVSCFHILRTDGTKEDFSYWKCIQKCIQKENTDGENKEENTDATST